MTTKTSLLTALRKYRPRDKSDPLENFITEAFAWLLQNHDGFSRFFYSKVTEALSFGENQSSAEITWSTQVNFDGVYPDMVCEAGGIALIFEHKAWSHLHENQLSNYRCEGAKNYGEGNFRVVVIAGGSHQNDQDPDLFLCWNHVYKWIKDWQDYKDYVEDFLFEDFCNLLESEGMGPAAPISHEAILSFLPAQNFELKLGHQINRLSKYAWGDLLPDDVYKMHMSDYRGRPWGDDRCGRIGLNLLGWGNVDWAPGIFVGFLVGSWDHGVEWLNPASPDFSIILDINIKLYADYDKHPLYRELIDQLRKDVEASCPEFEFHDHLESGVESPNSWHPIHIRMPMVDLFRGTKTAEEQDARFIEKASTVLKIITACEPFWALRKELLNSQLPVG